MEKITKEQAIKLAESKFYEMLTSDEIVKFQLFEPKLCMPFNVFHEAIEKVLDRPVYTHEFAFIDELKKEYLKEIPTPTLEQIINLIPEEKRLIIFKD